MPYTGDVLPTHNRPYSPRYVHGPGYETENYSTDLHRNYSLRPATSRQNLYRQSQRHSSPPAVPLYKAHTHQYRNEYEKSPLGYWKDHFVAATGEFVGTFLFLFLAFAAHLMAVEQSQFTRLDGTNNSETVVFISLAYGFSLLVNAWIFYRISGGLFNPAVCIVREDPQHSY